MNTAELAMILGVTLAVVGSVGTLVIADLLRRVVALNIASGGVMVVLIALAYRVSPDEPDPVPQALVLTGIVIMVAVTGVALALVRRIEAHETAPGDDDREGET